MEKLMEQSLKLQNEPGIIRRIMGNILWIPVKIYVKYILWRSK